MSRLLAVAIPAAAIKWGIVLGVVIATMIIAPFVGKIIRIKLSKPGRSEREKTLADPVARFATMICFASGLIAVLGITSPKSLEPFPTKIVEFIPRLMIAVLLLLIGSTASTFVANGVGVAMTKATGTPQPAIARAVKAIVMALIGIFAISQLGIDTTIVDTLTTALIFCSVGTLALLSVLGGRNMASELAAGRYIRRIVAPGDHIECAVGTGEVVAIHGATLEVKTESGASLHLPHSMVMGDSMKISKPRPSNASA